MQLQATPQDVLVQGSSPRHRLTPEGLGRGWMRFCMLVQWLRDCWVFVLEFMWLSLGHDSNVREKGDPKDDASPNTYPERN